MARSSSSYSNASTGLAIGVIVAIAISCVITFCVIPGIFFCLWRKRQSKLRKRNEEAAAIYNQTHGNNQYQPQGTGMGTQQPAYPMQTYPQKTEGGYFPPQPAQPQYGPGSTPQYGPQQTGVQQQGVYA